MTTETNATKQFTYKKHLTLLDVHDVTWYHQQEKSGCVYGVDLGYVERALDKYFGKVVAKATSDDYQGELILLIEEEQGYRLFGISYGSCSGCDYFQGLTSCKEVIDAVNVVYNNGTKFAELDEVWKYVNGNLWNKSWLSEESKDFLNKVQKLIQENNFKGQS